MKNSDLTGLHFDVKKSERMAPANGVDQPRAMFDRSPIFDARSTNTAEIPYVLHSIRAHLTA
jgi:hypothetical protein